MPLLKHTETGAVYAAPDDDGVVEHYADRGWVVVDPATLENTRDPRFGTYDADTIDAPADDAGDELDEHDQQ